MKHRANSTNSRFAYFRLRRLYLPFSPSLTVVSSVGGSSSSSFLIKMGKTTIFLHSIYKIRRPGETLRPTWGFEIHSTEWFNISKLDRAVHLLFVLPRKIRFETRFVDEYLLRPIDGSTRVSPTNRRRLATVRSPRRGGTMGKTGRKALRDRSKKYWLYMCIRSARKKLVSLNAKRTL